ncbi:MAG TPA: D-glycerate dehydrogenase [Deltaproteobacteria bacterium]|nr:D-glycerate dehydrogenase [Deltaproteobacteria bacterium]
MTQEPGDRLAVFVAVELIEPVRRELEAAFDVVFSSDPEPLRALRESDRDFDVLLFALETSMDARTIESLPPGIRALATYSVGTDHIDLEAARRRGLAVFHTPGVLADSVAENAIFLMLGVARRATESIDLIRSRAWSGWSPTQLVGLQLSGRRLGILGMGDIGSRVAHRARALGMTIFYSNRRPLPPDHALFGTAQFCATAEELIADVDVFLLACPSTGETRGIVDASLLSRARSDLILVNIARGDLVVDAALIDALRAGRIRGAGLDVFAGEPDLDPGYFDLPNVFMLPHIGSSTLEARLGMGRILIEGLDAWASGKTAPNRLV